MSYKTGSQGQNLSGIENQLVHLNDSANIQNQSKLLKIDALKQNRKKQSLPPKNHGEA